MLWLALGAILLTMALTLVRALRGPTAGDRMLAYNLFGTKTVLLIAVGGYALDWASFVDVALLYAMINFVSTIAILRYFEFSREPEPTPATPRRREGDRG